MINGMNFGGPNSPSHPPPSAVILGFKLRDRTRVIFHWTPHYILGPAESNGYPVDFF
jgi:hypothetical protein